LVVKRGAPQLESVIELFLSVAEPANPIEVDEVVNGQRIVPSVQHDAGQMSEAIG